MCIRDRENGVGRIPFSYVMSLSIDFFLGDKIKEAINIPKIEITPNAVAIKIAIQVS